MSSSDSEVRGCQACVKPTVYDSAVLKTDLMHDGAYCNYDVDGFLKVRQRSTEGKW